MRSGWGSRRGFLSSVSAAVDRVLGDMPAGYGGAGGRPAGEGGGNSAQSRTITASWPRALYPLANVHTVHVRYERETPNHTSTHARGRGRRGRREGAELGRQRKCCGDARLAVLQVWDRPLQYMQQLWCSDAGLAPVDDGDDGGGF